MKRTILTFITILFAFVFSVGFNLNLSNLGQIQNVDATETFSLPGGALPDATYNTSYYQTIGVEGPVANYTYSIVTGALPDGIGLYPGMAAQPAVLNGVPTVTGTFNFTVEAKDNTSGNTVTGDYSLIVKTAGIASSPTAFPDSGNVVSGTTLYLNAMGSIYYTIDGTEPTTSSSLYSGSLTINDDITVKTFAVRTGYDPSSISTFTYHVFRYVNYNVSDFESGQTPFDGKGYITGDSVTLLGIGNVINVGYTFSGWSLNSDGSGTLYQANDSVVMESSTLELYAVWDINPVSFSTVELEDGTYNTAYYKEISATSGSGGYSYSITAGSLPDGVTIYHQGVGFNLTISGIPTQTGTFNFTIEVTDLYNNTKDSADFTLYVKTAGQTGTPIASLTEENVFPGTKLFLYSNATVYYTTDGTTPTTDSTLYTSDGIIINASVTIKAVAIKTGYDLSEVLTVTYNVLYRVYYDLGTIDFGENPSDYKTYLEGDTVTVTGIINTFKYGYTFVGWTLNSDFSGTIYEMDDTFIIEDRNTTLYGVWEAIQVTLNESNLNNGTFESDYYQQINVLTGSGSYTYVITAGVLPEGITTSREFQAPFLTISGNPTELGTFPFSIEVTDNFNNTTDTFDYSITINLASGLVIPTADIESGEVEKGTILTLSVSEGIAIYYAIGDGDDTLYTEPLTIASEMVVTVYGQKDGYYDSDELTLTYTIKKHDVIYVTNTSESLIDEATYANGDSYSILGIGDIEKPDYLFLGWSLIDNDKTELYQGEDTLTMDSNDVTLYAIWVQETFTITYVDSEGTISTIEVDYGTSLSQPSDPVQIGYTFDGWFSDDQFSSPFNFGIPSEDSVVYAKWTINHYSITFYVDDETSDITQDYGTTIEYPADPIKEGYDFDGWYLDSELTELADLTTIPAESINLYAKFTIIPNPALNYTFEISIGFFLLATIIGIMLLRLKRALKHK